MSDQVDIKFMRRCIELAKKAEGLTYPNPLVGSVIVHDGRIIGEGFHMKAGEPHAEVNAITSVAEKTQLKFSTLYVNLEPCSHTGKTPPCADLIIASAIPRVVIGTIDTSDKVSGGGLRKLKEAGCEVITGIAEEECRRINRRFFTFHEKKRPYITLKWAQSADGFLDKIRYEDYIIEPNWITGKAERILVHKWRASEQAILVGAGTVNADNPKLNVRDWKGPDPMKIILSGKGSYNRESALIKADGTLIVFTNEKDAHIADMKQVILKKEVPSSAQVTEWLFREGVQSLLIEGGAQVLKHFMSTGLWDEARVFTGKSYFRDGIKAPLIQESLFSKTVFSGSKLEIYLNEKNQDLQMIDIYN